MAGDSRSRYPFQERGSVSCRAAGKPILRYLLDVASGHIAAGKLLLASREVLQDAIAFVSASVPRSLALADVKSPILVFTDGAFENGKASIGARLIDTLTGSRVTWAMELPSNLVENWVEVVGAQIITQVELLPILMARLAFNRDVANRSVLYMIDNDPARDGLIARGSRSPFV